MRSSTENIPHELLGEIFLLVLTYVPREWIPNLYISRSRLTSVCRRWRDIAVSDPRLWTTIALEEPDFRLPSLPFLRLCVERSRHLPLFIYLMGAFGEEWLDSPMFDLVQIVGAEIYRWKSFTYIAHTYTYTPLKTLVELQFDFPSARQLQSIKIGVDQQDLDFDAALYSFYAGLADLPALREVSICAADMFYASLWARSHAILTSAETTESWARWTHLELASQMLWQDAVFLFKHCSHVKVMRLKLHYLDGGPHPIQETPHVTQNTLRALHLTFTFPSHAFSPVIGALSFPHLEIFRYDDSDGPGPDYNGPDELSHWSDLLHMISRSPRLQVLVVNHSRFGREGLLAFIMHLTITKIPTVQVLIDAEELEANSSLEHYIRGFLASLVDPPGDVFEYQDWESHADLVDRGPKSLAQVVLLEKKRKLLVGWVEEWVAFKKFEGVGKLGDSGFGLHPVLEQASRPLIW